MQVRWVVHGSYERKNSYMAVDQKPGLSLVAPHPLFHTRPFVAYLCRKCLGRTCLTKTKKKRVAKVLSQATKFCYKTYVAEWPPKPGTNPVSLFTAISGSIIRCKIVLCSIGGIWPPKHVPYCASPKGAMMWGTRAATHCCLHTWLKSKKDDMKPPQQLGFSKAELRLSMHTAYETRQPCLVDVCIPGYCGRGVRKWRHWALLEAPRRTCSTSHI